MAIKISTQSSEEPAIVLNNIEYCDIEGNRFFKVSDSNGNEIRIEYIPSIESTWDHRHFEIILFENPYLTAENDVFEIYETTIKGRFGWIFPLATLESNENDFVGRSNFDHYRYVAYWKLLNLDIDLNYNQEKLDYRLSELFSNVCVCVLSGMEISKVPEFKIENYALSFLNFDYLIFNEGIKGKAVYNKQESIEILRGGNHRINIKKSNFDILENQFTKSLFIEHLYQSENYLVRYIFLYQILEHFIEEQSDKMLDALIESFQKREVTKNKLREQISRFSGERSLVKKIFEKSTIDKKLRAEFIERCGYLFKDIGEEVENNFEDVLYDLRNLITHRYRTIVSKTDSLKEITWLFESIIIELLINYNDSNNDDINKISHPITNREKKDSSNEADSINPVSAEIIDNKGLPKVEFVSKFITKFQTWKELILKKIKNFSPKLFPLTI